jgi:hypothetical protein
VHVEKHERTEYLAPLVLVTWCIRSITITVFVIRGPCHALRKIISYYGRDIPENRDAAGVDQGN